MLSYCHPQATVKDRFRQMGVLLGAIEDGQGGWAIPDLVLRANLRDALSEDFLPGYEAMLQRNVASASRIADKHIRYQVAPVMLSPATPLRKFEPSRQ